MDLLSGYEDVSYCPEKPKDPMRDASYPSPSGTSFLLPNHIPLVAPNPNPYLTYRQSLATSPSRPCGRAARGIQQATVPGA